MYIKVSGNEESATELLRMYTSCVSSVDDWLWSLIHNGGMSSSQLILDQHNQFGLADLSRKQSASVRIGWPRSESVDDSVDLGRNRLTSVGIGWPRSESVDHSRTRLISVGIGWLWYYVGISRLWSESVDFGRNQSTLIGISWPRSKSVDLGLDQLTSVLISRGRLWEAADLSRASTVSLFVLFLRSACANGSTLYTDRRPNRVWSMSARLSQIKLNRV